MGQATQQTKEMAIRIMEAVKSIYPELAEISKQTDFQITIEGDKKGVYLEFSMDWDPTADPEPEAVEIEAGVQVEDEEKERMKKALQEAKGNKKKAAELLGISDRSFKRKMVKYNIID